MTAMRRILLTARTAAPAAALLGGLLAASGAALAASPVPLGTFSDWRAFKLEDGSNTICYALSQPKDAEPKNVRRGNIYVMVANWPGRSVNGEVSVVPGYPYRDGSDVTANVDGSRVTLFTRNDSQNEGGAWVADRAAEAKMIAAMKRGNSLIVTGTSSRGTLTTDRYSLSGITAAIAAIDKACN